MSGKVMGGVWDLDLPHDQQAVLLAYADHADHEGGSVRPSIALIAWKTGYSHRMVQKMTAELIEAGILESVTQRTGGRGITTEYRINLEAGRRKPPFREQSANKKDEPQFTLSGERVNCRTRKGEQFEAERVNCRTQKGEQLCAPEPSLRTVIKNRHIEPPTPRARAWHPADSEPNGAAPVKTGPGGPDEISRTFALLTDPEIAMLPTNAQGVSQRCNFWFVMAEVLAWRHDRKAGKVSSPGSLLHRCADGTGRPITPEDKQSEFYVRHVFGGDQAAALRQRYGSETRGHLLQEVGAGGPA